jgi:hypothetical protein
MPENSRPPTTAEILAAVRANRPQFERCNLQAALHTWRRLDHEQRQKWLDNTPAASIEAAKKELPATHEQQARDQAEQQRQQQAKQSDAGDQPGADDKASAGGKQSKK